MLQLFELDENEILIHRLWIIMMVFFIPFYGLILIYFSDEAVDNMFHRLVISLFWIVLLILSFTNKKAKKYLALPSYIGNFLTIAWIIWIVHVNRFSPDYTIGLYLSFVGMGIINRTNKEMVIFYAYCLIIISFSFYIQPDVIISKMVFILSLIIIFLIHTIIMGRRDYINQNLKLLNQQLIYKNGRLKQFLYAASHHLKSPLRGIGSFSSLLHSRFEGKDEEQEYLSYISKNVVKMDQVLDDVMDFFKYDREDIEVTSIDVDDILKKIKAYLYQKHDDLSLGLPLSYPKKMTANQTQMNQLFFRIIENGIKYNLSKEKIISVIYLEDNKHHIFSISDNGIGIEPKHRKKIFDLFSRLHHENEFSGTGVGLAICKTIVENHKGDIWLEQSTPGLGTEFRFKIPKNL